MTYILFISLIILLFINFIQIKKNFLIDCNIIESHKISNIKTPLSGGIYFFSLFLIIDFFFRKISVAHYIFLFAYTLLGILADGRILNNAKTRFFFQLIISITFVFFFQIILENTRIIYLDVLLEIKFFNYFFLVFCFMTLLNGSNFVDGVNGFLTSYFILVFVSILLIDPLLEVKLANFDHFKIYLFPMILFWVFNLFNKNYLGDGGSYFLSVFVGLNLIYFINNNNNQVAPFFIINLLWYPCFENLFTILRRLKIKNKIYLPDQKHLHTLIYLNLQNKLSNNYSNSAINSFSSIVIIFSLLPMFIYSIYFSDSSIKLFYALCAYMLIYLYIYFKLLKNEKK